MSPTPPLTQVIGRTERALGPLMDRVLAGTGGTFHQWVALNFTAAGGESIDRSQLIARLTKTLEIDTTEAEATITEMANERLLETESGSLITFSDTGRQRYAAIRTAIDQTTEPLYADIPAEDLAATQRVLTTIADRADTQLART